eukprot:5363999-Amphidinium_carterae.1
MLHCFSGKFSPEGCKATRRLQHCSSLFCGRSVIWYSRVKLCDCGSAVDLSDERVWKALTRASVFWRHLSPMDFIFC